MECVPQRLKPYLFLTVYVRAEARTLQRTEFFRSLLRIETMALQDEPYTREFLLERTGRLSQAGGISHFTHADGKGNGVSTLRVRTARGLEYWVVPDRGMDIFEASFLGRSLCWHSPVGMVHPAYYSNRGTEWLRSFPGGMLSTCGLTTVGIPCEDNGERLGLHGSISNTPAESVNWSEHGREMTVC